MLYLRFAGAAFFSVLTRGSTMPSKISVFDGAFDMNDADERALGPRQRVIDKGVVAGTSTLNSVMTAPPAGTVAVWIPRRGSLVTPPRL